MRDDQISAILRQANPWWITVVNGASPTGWVTEHRLLRERRRYDLGYRTQVLDDVTSEPVDDKLIVLTGPRRVGKSIALLDAAAQLCARKDFDPRQLIHIPADGFSAQDLARAFALGRQQTRSVDRPSPRRRVWLLDEVSGIAGWTTILKRLRDQTSVGDDTVVATGSRWVGMDDITADLFAGRAGSSDHRRIRHVLPMSFRDYLIAAHELPLINSVPPWDLQSAEVRDSLAPLAFAVDDYDLAWQDYLRSGGFPRAVHEATNLGAISPGYARDLEAWLVADLEENQSPDSVALLLSGLAQRATSPLNLTKTARELGYESRYRLESRVTRLIATFAALECPQRDDQGMRLSGSQSKYYLADPLLAWLPPLLRAGLPEPSLPSLSEMALGTHLSYALEELQEGRLARGDTIGYGRTGSNNEIDFCPVPAPSAAGPRRTLPIESKWVSHNWRSEAKTIENKYRCGIVATRNVLDLEKPSWAIPAPLLALLLR